MADEFEELDPDLMFDMPEQQSNGMFGQGFDNSLDFQHDGLSASDLGAGFGNIRTSDAMDMDGMASPMHQAPFSLADELADAFNDPENDGTSRLLAEIEYGNETQDFVPSCRSSPLRGAKGSRATTSSHLQDDEDSYATNTHFEGGMTELQESLRDIQSSLHVISEHNKAITSTSAESEVRIETLMSNLIRSTYDHVKIHEEGLKDLEAVEADIRMMNAWVAPLKQVDDITNGASTDIQHADHPEMATDSTALSGPMPAPLVAETRKQDLLKETSDYRILSEQLANSLAAMSEHLHFSKASGTDHWRRLRAMDSGMNRLRSEVESLQLSQERIIRWEEGTISKQSIIPGLSTPPKKSSVSIPKNAGGNSPNWSTQAHMHLQAAQKLLDEATVQAEKLLST